MDPDAVPPELWMEIFEMLPLPSDLYSIMRTSKRFHDLVVRAIHRHVIWNTAQHLAHNLPLWDVHQGMEISVHTLELGVSVLPTALSGVVIDSNGDTVWQQYQPSAAPVYQRVPNPTAYSRTDVQRFASVRLHNAMLARIASFRNLGSLTFKNVYFSDQHLAMMHDLPRLHSLRIECCTIPGRHGGPVFNHQRLPIKKLALLNLRRGASDAHDEEGMTHLLTLALAHDLRSLHIDSTADVFRHVFHGWQAEAQGYTIPAHLERLYVERRQLLQQPAVLGEPTFPDASFYSFLSRASTLTTYSTYHPIPQQQHLQPGTLPLLRCYSGPVESMQGILPGRPIEAIQLLQCTFGQQGVQNHRDGITALATISSWFPDLQMLALEFSGWDDEIMYAVASLFHKLRRLKIVFDNGGPSEAMMSNMGPELLSRLPDLHTLELYSLSNDGNSKPDDAVWLFDSSFASLEEELRDLVIPWNKYCPALRKVQLTRGYIIERGFDGGRWNLLRISRANEGEMFCY